MNRVLNWVFGSFFRTLGRVLVYLLIGFLVAYALKDTKMPKIRLSDLLFMNVSADSETYSFSGSKISNKDFGSAYNWIGISKDTFNTLNFNLKLDYYYYYGELEKAPIGNDELVPVVFVSCTNALHPISGLYSSYYNFLDLNYVSNDTCSWSWESTPTGRVQYTFARLKPTSVNVDYIDSEQGTITYYWYTFTDQSFGIQGISYDSSIYFTDISYYNQSDYNDLLSKYKQMREQQINTQAQIDNATQNKNDIINNQNANSQAEIDNANQNKTDIINNHNANTDKEIESQKVCTNIKISKDNAIQDGLLNSSGQVIANANTSDIRVVTDFYELENVSNLKVLVVNNDSGANNLCFYDINKNYVSCLSKTQYNEMTTINIPTNAKYVRFTISKTLNIPQFEIQSCKNGNQAIGDSLNETNDFLTDDTPPDADISGLSTVQGLLPPGPVDSLLNIPVYFLSVLSSSMSGTCRPLQGDFIYDSTISIPCFSELIYENNSIPSALMLFINTIPSAFILIQYFKHLYKKVDRAVSMNASADDEWGVI